MNLVKNHFIKSTVILSSALMFTGCQANSNHSALTDLFFSSYNHLCEAETLSVNGTIRLSDLSSDLYIAFNQSPIEVAITTDLPEDQQIEFYICDGKTYLNFFGTKSQSLAANIGIEDSSDFHLPNPFLNLNRKERDAIFESITKEDEENVYTYTIRPVMMEKLIDDYGAANIERAVIKTKIVNEQFQSINLEVKGGLEIGNSTSPIDLSLSLDPIQVDEPVDIHFPADLTTWYEG